MEPVQGEMWEREHPEWIIILGRISKVDISEADTDFIKDIEKDYESLNIVDEAKKFVYYWDQRYKLERKKGRWKLRWKNWLEKTKRQKENYERSKRGASKNPETNNYFRSKEYLQEVRRKLEEQKSRRSRLD